ncbi:FxSxx-COOH system tetratricopeptide repeat protein [Actinomadura nitritigenes]|uniref:FxSxx-COOH system tetratricopeptide repeat protein n=1 Tax=Actinomadura nitritigenes TaxID=134602 RepID=UPI003D928AF8
MTAELERTGRDGAGAQERACVFTTFYGFQSGLGISTLLANVALELAAAGERVLIVDFELVSPTLGDLFASFTRPENVVRETDGVLEMIEGYRDALLGSEADPHAAAREHARPGDRPLPLIPGEFRWSGSIDLLGPGRREDTPRSFDDRARELIQSPFLTGDHGAVFVEEFRKGCEEAGYDHVLIDSRPERSPASTVCVDMLPDQLVLAFDTERSSTVEGGSKVAAEVSRPIRVLPMRLHDVGFAAQDPAAVAEHAFGSFLTWAGAELRGEYWSRAVIESDRKLTLGQALPWLHDRYLDTAVHQGCRFVAELLAGRPLPGPQPIPTPERKRLWDLHREVRRSGTDSVVVLAAPADAQWRQWIEAELSDGGLQVRRPDEDPGAVLEGVDLVFAVLSEHIAGAPGIDELRGLLATIRAGDNVKYFGLRVSDYPLDDVLSQLNVRGRVPADESAARRHLFGVFGPSRNPAAQKRHDVPFPGGAATDDLGLEARPPLTGSASGAESGQAVGQAPPIAPPETLDRIRSAPPRNPFFIGRDQILDELNRLLSADVPRSVVLTGESGSGKTQTALEFVWRFPAAFPLVWWAPASRPDELAGSLAELGAMLRPGTHRSVAEVLADLAAQPHHLLILDDAAAPGELAGLIPDDPAGAPRMLITSAAAGWAERAEPVELGDLAESEADLLVRRRIPGALTGEARQVVAEVGALVGRAPLALEQAAAWIRTAQDDGVLADPLGEYLNRLRAAIAGRRGGQAKDPESTWSMWAGAPALDGLGQAAHRLLDVCAFLAPEGVRGDLLRSPAMLAELARADLRFRDGWGSMDQVLREITGAALGEFDHHADQFRMHRLVQELVKREMGDRSGHRHGARAAARRVLAGYAPPEGELERPAGRVRYMELRRHLEPSGAFESDDPEVRRCLVGHVRFLYRTGEGGQAVSLSTVLERRWAERHGDADPYRLRMLAQLGNAYRLLGEHAKAKAADDVALAGMVRGFGPAHPFTLAARLGLGGDLRGLGLFTEAADEDETTYQGLERTLGPEAPATLSAANNLALSLYLTGGTSQALLRQAEIFFAQLRVRGPRHAYTWGSGLMLAVYNRDVGRLKSALRLAEEACRELGAIEGASGMLYLAARRTLVSILRHLATAGDPQALPEPDDLYDRYLATLGERHPGTLSCAVGEAALHHARGDTSGAYELVTDARRRYLETFGAEHPFTQMCGVNASIYALRLGDGDEAERFARSARERLSGLGAHHPFAIAATVALANVMLEQGDPEEARRLDEQAVAGQTGLGDNPLRLDLVQTNLAWHGRPEDARPPRRGIELDIPET